MTNELVGMADSLANSLAELEVIDPKTSLDVGVELEIAEGVLSAPLEMLDSVGIELNDSDDTVSIALYELDAALEE